MIEKAPGRGTGPTFVGIETSSYSGATLLAFLLDSHPQIASVGEMNGLIPSEDPETYLCSCGKRIRGCEFWQAVSCEMDKRGFEFDVAHFDTAFEWGGPRWRQRMRLASLGSPRLDAVRDMLLQALPEERRQLKRALTRNTAFVESVLEITGKCVFVDTSKDHLRARALNRLTAFDVRAIHLVRDPRGVAASRLNRGVRIDARQAARQWVRLHRRLQTTLSALPREKYIRVRYEDLCREPQQVLSQLFQFCGVDPDYTITDLRAAPHHIVGNAMRLNNLSAIRLDERWRELLTREQQQEIWQVAGRLGAQFGYH